MSPTDTEIHPNDYCYYKSYPNHTTRKSGFAKSHCHHASENGNPALHGKVDSKNNNGIFRATTNLVSTPSEALTLFRLHVVVESSISGLEHSIKVKYT